jgi:hypothetical protein
MGEMCLSVTVFGCMTVFSVTVTRALSSDSEYVAEAPALVLWMGPLCTHISLIAAALAEIQPLSICMIAGRQLRPIFF